MHTHNTTTLIISQFLLLILSHSSKGHFQENDLNYKITDYHLVSTKINAKIIKRDTLVSEVRNFLFTLDLYNDGRPLTITLRQRDSEILVPESIIQKMFKGTISNYESAPLEIAKTSQLLEGYVLEEPFNSSVTGYMKNNNFYGHLLINDSLFWIDELKEGKIQEKINISQFHYPEKAIATPNALVFKINKVLVGMILNQTDRARILFNELVRRRFFENQFASWKGKGRLCSLAIVIDYSFLMKVHGGNVEAAVFHVLFSLEEANAIFRSTDFDGDGVPDNIGFYVKSILVVTTPDPTYFLVPYQNEVMDVNKYILTFNRFPGLPKHCLGIAFTAQKFDKGTLGASYTPNSDSLYPTSGVCDYFYPRIGSLNGLIITSSTTKSPLVNQLIFEVTITHELGHSFGSVHDSGKRCEGYIMSEKSYTNYYAKESRLTFSECSKKSMIRALALKGGCLEPVTSSFCGNGLIEEGEDCDCGTTRDCLYKDPCCTPRRTREHPCKINRKMGFQCHPSQGECCTKDCRYSGSLSKYVTCRNFNKDCPCSPPDKHCACGLNGMCIEAECHSTECARISLKECACDPMYIQRTCQVCCLYEDHCITAYDATNLMLKNHAVKLISVASDNAFEKSEIFLEKTVCSTNESCHKLRFYEGKVGNYCLFHGKLGKCEMGGYCSVLLPNQSFPSFESSHCIVFRVNVLKMLTYVLVNMSLVKLVF
ncbi:disintegrin and metalloproteinase domain-containing protein 10-like isoform X1 [Anthonomus grandis grandis]|uniref:disintegrin and metalloproteinase domain-containing protein 10-like isoform X1 n=1 Tax=Anthonomus grandis grandis TaxID=2921223 RepID=UPI002166032E|nr:disintegrin and metalloproteinase domain-containing protein 10-like isoform X1 [Anthonomus grandis grandis]